MRRDLFTILGILLLSGTVALAANLGWHKLEWIRQAPPKPSPSEQEFAELTAEQVHQHINDRTAFLVDAREEQQYLDGHLRGALHLPSSAVYEMIENVTTVIPLEEKIVVYCGGKDCEASHNVAAVLREYSYTDVQVYTNGWEEIEVSCKFDDCIVAGAEP
jgi:rhodanese-related sulfurtransferase